MEIRRPFLSFKLVIKTLEIGSDCFHGGPHIPTIGADSNISLILHTSLAEAIKV